MAARWAGCLDTFDELPRRKQVDIVALYEVSWRIEAVTSWEAARK